METKILDKNLYYIGGVVRDEILGISSFDTDYCYLGNAIEFAKDFNIIKTNLDFGTVRILVNNKEIDIASTRLEEYPNAGHLPFVKKIGCSLEEDLQRRDFTINTLAKNTLTNEIVDLYNGRDDINKKIIRILHNKSFIDDPSRIIRALKFAIRFGFTLEKETQKLQEEYLKNINYDMSYHRIKKELKETFNLNKDKALKLFIEQNIYKLLGKDQVVPKLIFSIESLVNKYNPSHTWLVYLGAFRLDNFELNAEEKEIINSYYKIKDIKPSSDLEIFNLFKDLPLESILLYASTISYEIATKFLDDLSNVTIEISGTDLLSLGISQGKIYKEIFDFVLEKKFQYKDADKNIELKWVKERFL